MNFFVKKKLLIYLGTIVYVFIFSSCDEDLTTVGSGVIGSEPFVTGTQSYDVFAYNKNLQSVKTNNLPIYQLGVFEDPVYGTTEASVTTQLLLATSNPSFGIYSQSTEDGAETDDSDDTIEENETVTAVYLYIPYLTNSDDADGDGVPDNLDEFPEDSTNDSDGDGATNIFEVATGTDPSDDTSIDADGDGLNDTDGEIIIANNFAEKVDLDSIYGNRNASFNIKVQRSTFFLRDLDPNQNFEESQEYFSSQEFSPTFVSETINEETMNDNILISNREILLENEDDEDTEDVDESLTFTKLNAGIRIPLDNEFFQTNILDKEGDSELLNQANFNDFLRGIHLTLTPSENEFLMILFNLGLANITIEYEYDDYDSTEETVVTAEGEFVLSFPVVNTGFGNAVNTLLNDAYPAQVTDALDNGQNASRIYMKGGAGTLTLIDLFGETDTEANTVIDEIKSNNWIINEANLVFNIARDELNVVNDSLEPPRLYIYDTETEFPLYNVFIDFSDEIGFFDVLPQFDGVIEKSADQGVKYTVRITDYINDIVVRDSTNNTLGLVLATSLPNSTSSSAMTAEGEISIPENPIVSPLGTILYGPNIEANNQYFDKRLKLEISYTETD